MLDLGYGSLRLGRMLIPLLLEGRYFGIEPKAWLIDEGIAKQLGNDSRVIKKRRSSNDINFDCTVLAKNSTSS